MPREGKQPAIPPSMPLVPDAGQDTRDHVNGHAAVEMPPTSATPSVDESVTDAACGVVETASPFSPRFVNDDRPCTILIQGFKTTLWAMAQVNGRAGGEKIDEGLVKSTKDMLKILAKKMER